MRCSLQFPPGQFPPDQCRHELHGIFNECILEQQPPCPYYPEMTFAVKSFGVRLSGEPAAKNIMRGPLEGFTDTWWGLCGVVIPTVSPDEVFGGQIQFYWEDPLVETEPVVIVTVSGVYNLIQRTLGIGDENGEVSAAVQQRLRPVE
jgi:hypothetical protein